MQKTISIIVPLYNEEKNIPLIYAGIKKALDTLGTYTYEIIFVDDGSKDSSASTIDSICIKDKNVRLIQFTRNFGKEIALTAGIQQSIGDAVITIDSDLQQPPRLIPQFIKKWEAGAEVVIGVRSAVARANWFRRIGGIMFYKIINAISDVPIIPQGTDFRLLDRTVVDAFNEFGEKNRLTRGLIDWLGFKRELIYFEEAKRLDNKVSYSSIKLVRLAIVSFISQSLFPLKLAGYFGSFSFLVFGALGFFMILVKVFDHPWNIYFSGPAQIGVLDGFLISIVLMALGIVALYIAHIHEEVMDRPLYVMRKRKEGHF